MTDFLLYERIALASGAATAVLSLVTWVRWWRNRRESRELLRGLADLEAFEMSRETHPSRCKQCHGRRCHDCGVWVHPDSGEEVTFRNPAIPHYRCDGCAA